MPFTNEVIGTNGVLIRNWLQSANYIAGVSGWQITKAGEAEFSEGIFRGSIEVGSPSGEHFIVNNPATGNVIDIYDSSNRLIFMITPTDGAWSFDPVATNNPRVQMGAGGIAFGDTLVTQYGEIAIGEAPGATQLVLSSPILTAGGNSVDMFLVAPSAGNSYVLLNQHGILGTVVQNDNTAGANQFIHGAAYSGTTNGTGHVVVAHGCSFTPKGGVVTGTSPGGTFSNLTCGINSLTASQADINWTVANTNAAYAGQFITFDMMLWG